MNLPETEPLSTLQPPQLRRRNPLSTIQTKLTLPQNGFVSPSSIELASLKPSSLSYTSLKDLIPYSSSLNSPNAANSISNCVFKQADGAYLEPMSYSPGSSAPHFPHHLFTYLSSCLRFINSHIIKPLCRSIHQFLGTILVFLKRQQKFT